MDRLRKAAQHAEERVAKEFGGKLVSGSGSVVGIKADVRTDDELIEVKYTTRKSFSLKPDDLVGLRKSSHLTGSIPILAIEFDNNDNRPDRVVVLRESDYLNMRAWAWTAQRELGTR